MNLFQRYEEILRRLVTELKALYGARLVACAVYGSVGRGTPRQDSDVDVLIVARDLPRGRLERVEEYLPVEAHVEPLLQPADAVAITSAPVIKTPADPKPGTPLLLALA